MEWWDNRKVIEEDNGFKSQRYTAQEIIEGNYDLDLCGFPQVEEIILEPQELIANYQEERARFECRN